MKPTGWDLWRIMARPGPCDLVEIEQWLISKGKVCGVCGGARWLKQEYPVASEEYVEESCPLCAPLLNPTDEPAPF